MCARFKLLSILTSISLCLISVSAKKAKYGPGGMSFNDSVSCQEFSKHARFNPYSVLYQRWFVFFYWAPPRALEIFIFTFPTANHTRHLHKLLDGKTIIPIEWTARQLLMENNRNDTYLLVERGDRGQYWMFPLIRLKGQKIRPRDIRIKQTGDNRLLGYMDCDEETVYAMSKLEEVPPKHKLLDEASRLGYRSRRGKSYLYQGHEWMPIPEDDEERYWSRRKVPHKGWKMAPNEPETLKRPEEQVKPQPTQEPEKSEKGEKAPEPNLRNDQENSKSSSTAVKPESKTDQVNSDLSNEPGNSQITKKQPDNQETNVRQTIQSTDAVCSTHDKCGSNKEPEKNVVEEPDNTPATSEKHQANNEPEKVQKTDDPANLELKPDKQEEQHSTKEPDNHCYDCYETVNLKSTDKPYIPEYIQSSNNFKNKRLTNEPVTSQISDEPSGPHTTNKQAIGAQAYNEPTPSPKPPIEAMNSEFDNREVDWQKSYELQ